MVWIYLNEIFTQYVWDVTNTCMEDKVVSPIICMKDQVVAPGNYIQDQVVAPEVCC